MEFLFYPFFLPNVLLFSRFLFPLQGLDLPEILVEVEKQGSSFGELLAIPEQDDWIYADGKSASCVAFILEMYKAAGLFGPLSSSIQVTEFTVSSLRMFCYMFTMLKKRANLCHSYYFVLFLDNRH